MIKKYPNISIYVTSQIVHFYFFRFRLIRREIQHFIFCIGSYETDKAYSSAISLGVATKTRTKRTGVPPLVKRTNMTLTIRRYIRETNSYAIVDMENIRYTIRKGRYSDKQTTKRSFPIPALM